jgi:hypothetical protein
LSRSASPTRPFEPENLNHSQELLHIQFIIKSYYFNLNNIYWNIFLIVLFHSYLFPFYSLQSDCFKKMYKTNSYT